MSFRLNSYQCDPSWICCTVNQEPNIHAYLQDIPDAYCAEQSYQTINIIILSDTCCAEQFVIVNNKFCTFVRHIPWLIYDECEQEQECFACWELSSAIIKINQMKKESTMKMLKVTTMSHFTTGMVSLIIIQGLILSHKWTRTKPWMARQGSHRWDHQGQHHYCAQGLP